MPLLKYNITREGQVNMSLKLELYLNVEDNIEFEVEIIKDNTIYATKVVSRLLRLYYRVS